MKSLEAYKPDLAKTFSESGKMYADALRHQGGNVSFRALPPCDVEMYSSFDLTRYDFDRDMETYCDDLLAEFEKMFERRKAIDDNFIPVISPYLGIGDYSAFVAGEIEFRKDTSWSTPCLKKLEDFRSLPVLGSSKWYRKFLEISEILLKKTAKTGIPFMRGFFSPMDLAHSLRGEDLYYDMYDDPELLHEFLDYCAYATIHFAEDIYALVRRYRMSSPYGCWYVDGKINMSEDIACMISGDAYREFCAPHTQKVIDHFGVGYMHCHSRAMYLVKEICNLRNVAHLWLASDPNQPRPIDNIPSIVADANGVSVAIDCETWEEFSARFEAMKKGNFSVCLPVNTVEEALRVTEQYRILLK